MLKLSAITHLPGTGEESLININYKETDISPSATADTILYLTKT